MHGPHKQQYQFLSCSSSRHIDIAHSLIAYEAEINTVPAFLCGCILPTVGFSQQSPFRQIQIQTVLYFTIPFTFSAQGSVNRFVVWAQKQMWKHSAGWNKTQRLYKLVLLTENMNYEFGIYWESKVTSDGALAESKHLVKLWTADGRVFPFVLLLQHCFSGLWAL